LEQTTKADELWRIGYREELPDKSSACRRERQINRQKSRRYLEATISERSMRSGYLLRRKLARIYVNVDAGKVICFGRALSTRSGLA
jgi:predicted GIY-YIG superfamily endonuclease